MTRITEFTKVIWATIRLAVGGFGDRPVSFPSLAQGEACKTYKLFGKVKNMHGLFAKAFQDATVSGRIHFVGLEESFNVPLLSRFAMYISIEQVYRGDTNLIARVPPSALFIGPIYITPHKPYVDSKTVNMHEMQFDGRYMFHHADCLVVGVIRSLWNGVDKLTVSAVGTKMYSWLLGYIKLEGTAGLV